MLNGIALRRFLLEHTQLSEIEIAVLKNVSRLSHPMKMIQGMVPLLDLTPRSELGMELEKDISKGLILAAKMVALVTSMHRLKIDEPILSTRKECSFVENFFFLYHGRNPTEAELRVFEIAQILQIEHGFNASTFTARVAASTGTPLECAVSSAVGSLFGPLHGGADEASLQTMLDVGPKENAGAFVEKMFASKQKIMGMGHREYKVMDPRARILKSVAREMTIDTPLEGLYATFDAVENAVRMKAEDLKKKIEPNVEFYKGLVFYALGFSPIYFTSLFATSRVYGYISHIAENNRNNRIIRPKAFYVGDSNFG